MGGCPGHTRIDRCRLYCVTAGTLYLGDLSSGAITITADITRPAAAVVYLTSGGEINFSSGSFDTNGGNLRLSPGNTGSVGVARSGVDVSVGPNGTLAFDGGSDLSIVIDGTTVDTQYSRLSVAGQVNLTGVNLVLSGAYAGRG